jgi:hypothetical protein
MTSDWLRTWRLRLINYTVAECAKVSGILGALVDGI